MNVKRTVTVLVATVAAAGAVAIGAAVTAPDVHYDLIKPATADQVDEPAPVVESVHYDL